MKTYSRPMMMKIIKSDAKGVENNCGSCNSFAIFFIFFEGGGVIILASRRNFYFCRIRFLFYINYTYVFFSFFFFYTRTRICIHIHIYILGSYIRPDDKLFLPRWLLFVFVFLFLAFRICLPFESGQLPISGENLLL